MARARVILGTSAVAAGLGFSFSDNKEVTLRYVRAARAFSRMCWRYKVFEWEHGGLARTDKAAYEEMRNEVHVSCAQIALDLCRRNGGIFIKAGQHAATLKPGR